MITFNKKAESVEIELVACGFSLNNFKVGKTNFPKEMTTVDNGILYHFQLQKKDINALVFNL